MLRRIVAFAVVALALLAIAPVAASAARARESTGTHDMTLGYNLHTGVLWAGGKIFSNSVADVDVRLGVGSPKGAVGSTPAFKLDRSGQTPEFQPNFYAKKKLDRSQRKRVSRGISQVYVTLTVTTTDADATASETYRSTLTLLLDKSRRRS